MKWLALGALLGLAACGAQPPSVDAGSEPADAGAPFDAGTSVPVVDAGDRFADHVVRFTPGAGAGFGQDRYPEIVFGPPQGTGSSAGSLDVLSLGNAGVIELEFTDIELIDGPGVDLLVFENPFTNFLETGVVAVSVDGVEWREFSCEATNFSGGYPGCAGVTPVNSNSENGLSPLDAAVAGGDGFDLAKVGLTHARFVRVRDSGANTFYGAPAGGFDLDALAVVNGLRLDGGAP